MSEYQEKGERMRISECGMRSVGAAPELPSGCNTTISPRSGTRRFSNSFPIRTSALDARRHRALTVAVADPLRVPDRGNLV